MATSTVRTLGSSALAAALFVTVGAEGQGEVTKCLGTVPVAGQPMDFSVVATKINMPDFLAGPVRNDGGVVRPEMWGRAYLADQCTADASYSNTDYSAFALLGKRFVYTTDVSEAGCGCNAALYLVSMKQNSEVSGCEDYYCDANSVCGVRCDEIDIQEANKFAWHSALHRYDDGNGIAQGLGGWVRDNHFEMTPDEYGPGASCIDTNSPFQVAVSFPVTSQGKLASMDMKLSQERSSQDGQPGTPCEISFSMNRYDRDSNFEHLTQSLVEGMTVVISYWKSEDMLWLDGPGAGGGPCVVDDVQCGTAPKFSNFAVEDLPNLVFYP